MYYDYYSIFFAIEKDKKFDVRMCMEFDDENSFLMMSTEKRMVVFVIFRPFFLSRLLLLLKYVLRKDFYSCLSPMERGQLNLYQLGAFFFKMHNHLHIAGQQGEKTYVYSKVLKRKTGERYVNKEKHKNIKFK